VFTLLLFNRATANDNWRDLLTDADKVSTQGNTSLASIVAGQDSAIVLGEVFVGPEVNALGSLSAGHVPVNSDKNTISTIYLVLAFDTEASYLRDSMNPMGPIPYHAEISVSGFEPFPGKEIYESMQTSWRETSSDSYGAHAKLTWYVLDSEMECQSTEGSCLSAYDYMMAYSSEIASFGDEVAWHYHNTDWKPVENQENYDGLWSQLFTFDSSSYTGGTDIELGEKILNHLLIDRSYFPQSFRSGWTWENNDYSLWLENITLNDYSNLSPAGSPEGSCDWSRAPEWPETQYYHPSVSDYQSTGIMKRFIVHCNTNGPMNENRIDQAIQEALTGRNIICGFYTHAPGNVRSLVNSIDEIVQRKKVQYDPVGIRFEYATASEALKRIRRMNDDLSPETELVKSSESIFVISNEDIFNSYPYLVIALVDGTYLRLHGTKISNYVWKYSLGGIGLEAIETVGVASIDIAGNVGIEVIGIDGIEFRTFGDGSIPPVYDKQSHVWVYPESE